MLWCVPFFFTNYNHTIYLTTTYMTSYGDVPAGLVFGGAVAAWLALRQNSAPKWAVLPILALSANIKANTFVLALVAAGLVAVDEWLFADDGDFKAGLLPRTGFSLACFAAPMAIYYLWNVRYVGWLVSRSANDSGVGETSAPLSAVVVNGIKILLGQPVEGFYAEREAQFRTAMADMGHQFWTSDGKLSMIGQGRNVVALIAIVFVVAILAAASRRLKARIAVIGALSGVCFLGYNLMLALSYGFIFKTFQAEQLTDYNRYIYSYYIGWFILALGCLSVALLPQITVKGGADGPTAVFAATRRETAPAFELFVLALACGNAVPPEPADFAAAERAGALPTASSPTAAPSVPRPSWCAATLPPMTASFMSGRVTTARAGSAPCLISTRFWWTIRHRDHGPRHRRDKDDRRRRRAGPARAAARRGCEKHLLPRLYSRGAGQHRARQRLHGAVYPDAG